MQTSYTISLLAIFLHICLYFNNVAFSQPSNTSILDVDGNKLQTNTKYYIFPIHRDNGGLGLSVRDRHVPCPPHVLQQNSDTSTGLSVKLFPLEKSEALISLSSDVNIVFMGATTCVQSTVWRLGGVDEMTGHRYVKSGGVLGRPGAETVENWFKVEKSGEGYKMVYCPSVCGTCRVSCGELGVFVEDGRRWLGVGGIPLVIAFKKVV